MSEIFVLRPSFHLMLCRNKYFITAPFPWTSRPISIVYVSHAAYICCSLLLNIIFLYNSRRQLTEYFLNLFWRSFHSLKPLWR